MDANSIVMMIADKLPKDAASQMALRDSLAKLSAPKLQDASSKIAMLGLRSPGVVFWVGSFLFGALGVGRFLIGDKLLGFLRLAVFIAYVAFIYLTFASAVNDVVGSFEGNLAQFERELNQAAKAYEQGRDYTFSTPSSSGGEPSAQTVNYSMYAAISAVITWVWWVLDLFLVGRKLRRKNYDKVMQAIQSV